MLTGNHRRGAGTQAPGDLLSPRGDGDPRCSVAAQVTDCAVVWRIGHPAHPHVKTGQGFRPDLYSLLSRRRGGRQARRRPMTADPRPADEPKTLQDPLAESLRVVDLAQSRGLLVRLMGGMAVRAHAPDWPARTRRVEVDLDFATRGKDRGGFYELLASEGYTAD